jgi:DNA modification methylase
MQTLNLDSIYLGDAKEVLSTLPDKSIDCCVTSPPYFGLRDYGVSGQLGMEQTPEEYIENLVAVFREVHRVLTDTGTLWIVIGDSYAGGGGGNYGDGLSSHQGGQHLTNVRNKKGWLSDSRLKPKDLIGIPWMLAFALRADGWYLRQDIIWSKGNPLPESVRDRCTKSHEYIFLLTKSQKYYFEKMLEPAMYDGRKDTRMKGSHKYSQNTTGLSTQTFAARGHERWQRGENGEFLRNKRDVWQVNTKPFKDAHFAVFPEALIAPCILAGCPKGGVVLDPFIGSGTTAIVALKNDRHYVGIELNPEYIEIVERRMSNS